MILKNVVIQTIELKIDEPVLKVQASFVLKATRKQ